MIFKVERERERENTEDDRRFDFTTEELKSPSADELSANITAFFQISMSAVIARLGLYG